MILVPTKAESGASSPLGLANLKDEKTSVSFSQILHGAKDSKDEKGVQNGSFFLSLGADEKEVKVSKDTLSSLLKNNESTVKEKLEVPELNPKITQNLSVAEVKTLIVDAKQFLKDKIHQSVEYIKSEVKDLPKTLKGLALVAKKFGIDVSKITLEEVSPTLKKSVIKSMDIPEIKVKNDVEAEKENVKVKGTTKLDPEVDEAIEIKVKIPKTKQVKEKAEQDVVQEVKIKEEIKESVKADDKKVEVLKEVKATPLFKAYSKAEYTTEQLVQTKQLSVEEKTPKVKADETLKLLLRGDKASSDNTQLGMTKDFTVATAKVIAPSAVTQVGKETERLLRGDVVDDVVKTDTTSAKDVDSFDVKVKEAKQMMKYLSQDVKTAIEDYKSPFTRVKVQLNPAKMGEVDLTVVQRGKNLHVNLSSNNVAINTLAINANDLKVQLNNNGIQNATLNFSDSSQNSDQNAQQQQNRHNERKAEEEYNYFDNEEQNEEIVNSLEIVVPNYA